jgi:hypothetical protein
LISIPEQDANLLEGIGEAELTDEKIKLAEAFICKLYNQVTDTSDETRDLAWQFGFFTTTS